MKPYLQPIDEVFADVNQQKSSLKFYVLPRAKKSL